VDISSCLPAAGYVLLTLTQKLDKRGPSPRWSRHRCHQRILVVERQAPRVKRQMRTDGGLARYCASLLRPRGDLSSRYRASFPWYFVGCIRTWSHQRGRQLTPGLFGRFLPRRYWLKPCFRQTNMPSMSVPRGAARSQDPAARTLPRTSDRCSAHVNIDFLSAFLCLYRRPIGWLVRDGLCTRLVESITAIPRTCGISPLGLCTVNAPSPHHPDAEVLEKSQPCTPCITYGNRSTSGLLMTRSTTEPS